jgi:hypothetical protein
MAVIAISIPLTAAPKKINIAHREIPARATIWAEPTDIASRDLFYGPGGKEDAPRGTTFTFEKEDLDGTNPKFVVRDRDGVKWKIKLGEEARPETVASRLVWAVGYFTDEDYFLSDLRVEQMPAHLHRGGKLVAPDGSMHSARLKRYINGEEKAGDWEWRDDPFTGSREWNGLRVLMALINNWDLKDENNKIREYKEAQMYIVSDLGSSFGTTGRSVSRAESKGNLRAYEKSRFIAGTTATFVDFRTPSRPALIHLFEPREYFRRIHLEWIGKGIPRSDARWIGEVLGRLSAVQIQSAFRAAGYTTREVNGFSGVVEKRIDELKQL